MRNYEIDKLVAEKVLGLEIRDRNIVRDGKRSGIPLYSTDIEQAWKVIEYLEFDVKITKHEGISPRYQCHVFDPGNVKMAFAETAPMAICKAALCAVGEVIE